MVTSGEGKTTIDGSPGAQQNIPTAPPGFDFCLFILLFQYKNNSMEIINEEFAQMVTQADGGRLQNRIPSLSRLSPAGRLMDEGGS